MPSFERFIHFARLYFSITLDPRASFCQVMCQLAFLLSRSLPSPLPSISLHMYHSWISIALMASCCLSQLALNALLLIFCSYRICMISYRWNRIFTHYNILALFFYSRNRVITCRSIHLAFVALSRSCCLMLALIALLWLLSLYLGCYYLVLTDYSFILAIIGHCHWWSFVVDLVLRCLCLAYGFWFFIIALHGGICTVIAILYYGTRFITNLCD